MKCFYHSADLDGHCSGELVRRLYPDCEMIGINYGDSFPWGRIGEDGDKEGVVMVDFALQPFSDMIKLWEMLDKHYLIWIDHHKSAIEEWKTAGSPAITGVRRIGEAGCELTHEYFYPRSEMPMAVYYLGRYDVWDHKLPPVLPFQYGMKLHNTLPGAGIWDVVLGQYGRRNTAQIVADGGTILKYIEADNKRYLRSYSFDTKIDGFSAVAVNRGLTNSKLFDTIPQGPYGPQVLITFCWDPKADKWTVSLYSDTVDVSEIANRRGGGGHKGAAGFQCNELPFLPGP